ncbi:hypothetical protein HETIRDRAFT_172912 [Heterobasidion irregulare TC 32-1]|uniref:Uncharacterized protein n=1 Tax=Heterobasidion irregulare (strain TC 32-1) TaxID=747525 RepID=W4K0K6_HETIT|nr:uncharacterized protein HETIRDRAFT_172912 [Heterobasidion irregulare TC 32-1]ETW79348.1 hypothetical protein HETIRDRAFT_172912 [Heterobasidion irregulare TC 32-1]
MSYAVASSSASVWLSSPVGGSRRSHPQNAIMASLVQYQSLPSLSSLLPTVSQRLADKRYASTRCTRRQISAKSS